ncbi:MAG: hypothetical protein C3F13_12235 [Anaerolineales bacterium]|nr:MAG: hypothetical protein C3F13_12235 [Anaerolineales bacterium]
MKRNGLLLLLLSIILAWGLSGCQASSSSSIAAANSTGTNDSQNATSMSEVNQLLVGTLKLDGTANALTSEQAAQLLPLWQAYLSLSNSDTAAEAEVGGLLKQIQASMTAQQIDAITDMNLTSTDMMELMQSMGGPMGPRGTPDPNSTPSFDFPSGGNFQAGGEPPEGFSGSPPSGFGSGGSTGGQRPNMPSGGLVIQGGPMGDVGSAAGLGGGPMGQGTQDPSIQATAQARFSTQANRVNTMLLQALIMKLQSLTGATQPTPTPTP